MKLKKEQQNKSELEVQKYCTPCTYKDTSTAQVYKLSNCNLFNIGH